MGKFKSFFHENKTFVLLLIGCLILLALFVGVATLSGSWPGSDASSQILSALAGAVVAAIITLFLLLGQTSSEEKKERNTKVFEKKLEIYQEFLQCLYEVIKDGEVSEEEAIRLQFQTSYITMHTDSERIKVIAEKVHYIVSHLGEDNNTGQIKALFNIVDEFRKELYLIVPSVQDENNIDGAINSFSSIIDVVKRNGAGEEITSVNSTIDIAKNLKDFAETLRTQLEPKMAKWSFETGDFAEGLNLNICMKGHEEDIRVLLSYEDGSDDYYFQVHLEHDDSSEVYKHMKWRFGGRQNKWCWWKYLDVNWRKLANTQEIRTREWGDLLKYVTDKLVELMTYIELFVKVRDEVYCPELNSNNTKVFLWYNLTVAYEYGKSLFFDVVMKNDRYSIIFGRRDNNIERLLSQLQILGIYATKQGLIENRFEVYNNLSADDAVKEINNFNSKLNTWLAY